MNIFRRALWSILLASVVTALGDAPYVDEMFDALAPAATHVQQAAGSVAGDGSATRTTDHSPRSLRIYQALAAIFVSPAAFQLPDAQASGGYAGAPFRSAASPDPRRIERPPAPRAA